MSREFFNTPEGSILVAVAVALAYALPKHPPGSSRLPASALVVGSYLIGYLPNLARQHVAWRTPCLSQRNFRLSIHK